MTTKIEQLDRKRKQYRQGHLIWSLIFLTAWLVRSALKIFDVETDLVYTVLLVILLLAIALQTFYTLKDQGLKAELRNDPHLKDALHDELVQLNELKAWRIAFFALMGFIVLSAILSLIIDIKDMMYIFLTAMLIGFGAYNTSVFYLNR
jgi:SNF family Na+-dependent transporter